MKPVDAKDNAYIDCSKEVNDKDLKFKVGDYVRISKYQIGLKRFLWLKKLKIQFHGHTSMISIMNKLLEHFTSKN